MGFLADLPGHMLDAFLRGAEAVAAHPLLALVPLFTAGTAALTAYTLRVRR